MDINNNNNNTDNHYTERGIAQSSGSFFLHNNGILQRHLYEIYSEPLHDESDENEENEVIKLYYVHQTTVQEMIITSHDIFQDFDCK